MQGNETYDLESIHFKVHHHWYVLSLIQVYQTSRVDIENSLTHIGVLECMKAIILTALSELTESVRMLAKFELLVNLLSKILDIMLLFYIFVRLMLQSHFKP